jgi:uncharacterized protein YlaN (UPF0358 family)
MPECYVVIIDDAMSDLLTVIITSLTFIFGIIVFVKQKNGAKQKQLFDNYQLRIRESVNGINSFVFDLNSDGKADKHFHEALKHVSEHNECPCYFRLKFFLDEFINLYNEIDTASKQNKMDKEDSKTLMHLLEKAFHQKLYFFDISEINYFKKNPQKVTKEISEIGLYYDNKVKPLFIKPAPQPSPRII